MRYLNGGQSDLVEIKEVAAAVRMIRRHEAILKVAKKNNTSSAAGNGGGGGGGVGGLSRPSSPPSMADGTKHLGGCTISGSTGAILDDAAERGWSGEGDGSWGGAEYLWECPAVCGLGGRASSLEVRGGLLRCWSSLEVVSHRVLAVS